MPSAPDALAAPAPLTADTLPPLIGAYVGRLLDAHGAVSMHAGHRVTWKSARERLEAKAGAAFVAGQDALAVALRTIAAEMGDEERTASRNQDAARTRLEVVRRGEEPA